MTSDIVGALPPGTQLLEYVIEGVLGHGGFGITYLARDTNLDKVVALKEYLPADLAVRVNATTITVRSSETEEAFRWGKDNFLKEARVLARFSNPHIIQVHRFFEAHGTAYFVMEYAEGTTLAKHLKANPTLDEERIRAVLMPILAGLEHVHRAGVLHRDIKPDNIILRRDGSPVLIDFGASKQNIGSMTRSVLSVLTAGYAPLEQYASSGNQGPWTDLYAMGAVAYRCITGKKPVESVNRLRDDPLLPASVVGFNRFSPHFLAAIDWALAVNGEDRPQSILEWRQALDGTRPVPAAASPRAAAPVDLGEDEGAATAMIEKRPVDGPAHRAARKEPATDAAPAAPAEPVRIPIREHTPAPAKSGRGPLVWVAAFVVAVAAGVVAKVVTDKGLRAPAPATEPARPAEKAAAKPAATATPAQRREAPPTPTTVAEPPPSVAAPKPAEPARTEPEPAKTPAKVAEQPVEKPAEPVAKPAEPAPKPVERSTAASEPPATAKAEPAPARPAEAAPVPKVAPPAKAVAQMAPLATFQDCPRCPVMTVLPAGSFQMGSPKDAGNTWEMPQRTVRIARPFALGKHEVTAAEYKACVDARACAAAPAGMVDGDAARAPVVNVTWAEARAYADWLTRTTGRRYRLPTEAEWEYAMRAGTKTARFWGEDRRDQCLYANAADQAGLKRDATLRSADCNDGGGALTAVGRLRANAFHLHDLAGNAWEWTQDCWKDSYAGAPTDGRAVDAPSCTRRVMRGGSWRSKPESLRSANRGWSLADKRVDEIGLRVVAE